jgi:hypothetical protein
MGQHESGNGPGIADARHGLLIDLTGLALNLNTITTANSDTTWDRCLLTK